MNGKFTIRGMNFHAFHGFLEVERELGQVFSIDVILSFPLKSEDASPSAVHKIRGAEVYDLTRGVVMGTKYTSHFSLAIAIARIMLKNFEITTEAKVIIGRKQLFIPGNVDQVLAEVTCDRGDLE